MVVVSNFLCVFVDFGFRISDLCTSWKRDVVQLAWLPRRALCGD